ncbi:hypothetical protein D9619_004879 [Psilocybe cf. subviscida]|uniref:F-box domain-containing protein n=1 Tax=Psilocybe cf. subviscida TaxID=2480587 RepID=A0A8H5F7Y2_9AGAR|nr:hypothetical protein D9619_004879 [Psilocybe cf. subviscida]
MSPILPYELHPLIIQKARGKSSLLSLSLCCSSFRDVAQSILFQYPAGISTPDQQHSLIHSIISSPERLGPMVRIFICCYGKESPDVPGGTYHEVATALRAMSNLKQLVLSDASRYPPTILDGCTFHLETFHVAMQSGINAFLTHFLPTQPDLKHLGIDTDVAMDSDGGSVGSDEWFDTEEDSDDGSTDSEPEPDGPLVVPPDICPHLESLDGAPYNVMVFFADGRPIKRLDWNDINLPPAFPPITQFPLEYLKISPTLLSWGGRISYGATMNSLVTLELVAAVPITERMIPNYVAFMSRIPTLRVLILSSHRRDNWSQSIIQRIFEQCQTLQHIDLQYSLSGTVFKRFFPPKVDGQMEQKVVNLADVYRGVSWMEDKYSYLEYRNAV